MIQSILSHSLVGAFCFYLGILIGFGRQMSVVVEEAVVPSQSQPQLQPQPQKYHSTITRHHRLQTTREDTNSHASTQQNPFRKSPFPYSSKKIFVDFATVPRDDFNSLVEIGVPLDETTKGAEDVLILYTSGNGMPTGMANHDKINIPAEKALANCHEVKVMLQGTYNKKHNQCLAIVPQWESYHLHKFLRISPKNSSDLTANLKYPLQAVPRTRQHDGIGSAAIVPNEKKTAESNELLIQYLRHKQRVQRNLESFLGGVLATSKNPSLNALVIMTCNKGQSELLSNFVCNTKAKGLDLSHVVVFATDEYTKNLCHELGVHVWYDAGVFAIVPQGSAKQYGDQSFAKIMIAKVYALHLAMVQGCDILFQDVDVIWHKNPLPYLASNEFETWDMVFQDDGSRPWRYAPYSPNTGFYFERNTPLTRHLVETLLRSGDAIQVARSHQHVMNDILVEFSTSKGLRAKVVRKGENNPFLGGVEFHNQHEVMHSLLNGTSDAYVFHMSWTHNKENKIKFLQQLGEWYWSDEEQSCLARPEITCHYRDKPSKVPCVNSPRIDGDHSIPGIVNTQKRSIRF